MGIIDKRYERSIWGNSGIIEFKGRAKLGLKTRIACNGKLTFGKGVCFNSGSDIICWKSIQFGDDCLISWDTLFMDTDFHRITMAEKPEYQINPDKEIIIGDHVWIGCHTTILKGSVLPDNSVIAAGSVIAGTLEDTNSIYINNRAVKKNIDWKM